MTIKLNSELLTPAIHGNGNSKGSLIKDWTIFCNSIHKSLKAFPNESYHGRNHYVKGDKEHDMSKDEYIKMVQSLEELKRVSEEVVTKLLMIKD